MRRSFRGPRVIVPKANEKVAFGASPKLTNFRLYLLSHEELLTQDSGLNIVKPRGILPHQFAQARFAQVLSLGHRLNRVRELAVAMIVVCCKSDAVFTDTFHK